MSATNAPVSVHISYQCSIGPDSPIYDVAHTPAPKPMARKVTKRRPQDLLPPTPPPRVLRSNAADPSIEGVGQFRRRWAAAAAAAAEAAAAAARARVQQKVPVEFETSALRVRRRSQSFPPAGGPIQHGLTEGADSPACVRRRRNLARKGGLGGSARGPAKRPGPAPVPRPRSMLSIPGYAQPKAVRSLNEDGDEDVYMNLATASAGDVSSAAMGFLVCDDSGDYGGDLVEDIHGNFQTTIDIDDITAEVGALPAPAWDAPLPSVDGESLFARGKNKTVDSGYYGDDAAELGGGDAELTAGDAPPDSDANAAIPMSLRSNNAGRSMVRRLGTLMGELAGELQSVRVAHDSSDAVVDA